MRDTIDFMMDLHSLGSELDSTPPEIPDGHGKAAWIRARAAQATMHTHSTRRHRIERITVNGSPADVPADLAENWPAELPPVTVDHKRDRHNDPIPAGTYRMWLEISYDPSDQDPGDWDRGMWLEDSASLHGISPEPDQEQELRNMPGIGAVWASTRPETLEEALRLVRRARA